MAHFAKVDNGLVVQVIVAEPEFFETFVDTTPGEWLQTSYNTRGGVHYGADGLPDDGEPLRGNFAGLGYTYDAALDVFYAPQPYPSWKLSPTTFLWESPVEQPTDGDYMWDEDNIQWVLIQE